MNLNFVYFDFSDTFLLMAYLVMMRDISFFIRATTSTWKSASVLFSFFCEVVGECGAYSWSSSFSNISRNLAYLDVAIFLEDLFFLLESLSRLSEVAGRFGGRPFFGLAELLMTCLIISGVCSDFNFSGEDVDGIGDALVDVIVVCLFAGMRSGFLDVVVDIRSGFLIFIICFTPPCLVA